MFEIRPIFSALLRHKSSTLLIVLQIAITLAVVVNAIFIISERIEQVNAPSGVAESEIISMNILPFDDNYNIEQNIRADLELMRNLPGVVNATAMNAIPLGQGGDSSSVSASQEDMQNNTNINVAFFRGDSHILDTLDVKIIEGRNYTEEEVLYSQGGEPPKVALITDTLAKRLFKDESAVGKNLYYGNASVQIIGVIDYLVSPWVHHRNHNMAVVTPIVHLQGFKRYVIRAEPSAVAQIMGEIEDKLIARNANRVVFSLRTLSEYRERSYRSDEAMMKILIVVIALLILITALGIVGIVSFNISQRIKQIGTRRALGATTGDIQRYFLTENVLISGLGVALGTALTIAFNIYLVQEFQLAPLEWFYIPLGILAMVITGLVAVWLPAKRASKVSPAVATQTI